MDCLISQIEALLYWVDGACGSSKGNAGQILAMTEA